MEKRKYFTEFSFKTHRKYAALTTPYELSKSSKQDKEYLEQFKVYFICKRPRIIPQKIEQLDTDTFSVQFIFASEVPKHLSINLKITFFDTEQHKAKSLSLSGPQNRFLEIFCDCGYQYKVAFSAFIQKCSFKLDIQEVQKLEVIYIGKSHADETTIYDRLTSHSTIQRIQNEISIEEPNYELVFYLFSFVEAQYLSVMNPRYETEKNDQENADHVSEVLNSPFEPREQTAITEASFIRYFRPKYNELLKDSFPSTDLELLRKCYKIDLCGIITEVNTDDIGAMFYTQDVVANVHHIAIFDLHQNNLRKIFFTI